MQVGGGVVVEERGGLGIPCNRRNVSIEKRCGEPDDRRNQYAEDWRDPGCVTVIGGQGQTFVNSFQASESNFEGKLGFRVFDPRVYIAIADLSRTNNYGYPAMNSGGIGVEKLPDLIVADGLELAYTASHVRVAGVFPQPLAAGRNGARRVFAGGGEGARVTLRLASLSRHVAVGGMNVT